jgi:hypothetical protein
MMSLVILKPNVILFSATKVEDSGGPRRAKLYDRFAKKFADESGYKVSRLETPDESYFMLTAPGLKLVEGLSLMERACLEGGHNLEDFKENMSITGTERQRSERDKKLTPGSEAWFRHWFSRPFLRREQVEQLKQEAVKHIKGARHEKATNRRRSDRNIRTNERRGTRRC